MKCPLCQITLYSVGEDYHNHSYLCFCGAQEKDDNVTFIYRSTGSSFIYSVRRLIDKERYIELHSNQYSHDLCLVKREKPGPMQPTMLIKQTIYYKDVPCLGPDVAAKEVIKYFNLRTFL